MRYWNDMNDKWGFSDGEAVPTDAQETRPVYIKAVNTFAERLGSKFRVQPYDRPGLHNWCMVVGVPVDGTLEESLSKREESDRELDRAIEIAMDMDLDQYVVVDIHIDEEGLDRAIAEKEVER